MKKVFCILLFCLFICTTNIYCLSFSNEYMSFDEPQGYDISIDTISENYRSYTINHQDVNTVDNIVINITGHNSKYSEFEYTEEYLELLLSEMKIQFEKAFDSNVEMFNKGISTVGSKNYKCFVFEQFVENYDFYQKQYSIMTDNYVYTITLTSFDKSYFFSDEALTVLNSFTINDTISEKTSENSIVNKVMDSIITTSIVTLILSGIYFIINHIRKKNKADEKEYKETEIQDNEELTKFIDKLEENKKINKP